MKIGVISDTHSRSIPKQVLDDFKKVDLIVHAGDFCSPEDLKIFKKMADVRAVFGNMDGLELRQILPERDIFEVEGLKIGVYHGHGPAEKVPDLVRAEFKADKVDIVIFGHSHQPFNKKINNVLYFNPGSPSDTVRSPYCSYGILEIIKGKVSGKIVKVDGCHG
ncbi:MAG TPA: metallophosphoesterase family protein [Candidatus Omnitrophota bacterium]|nr:metallophosphoesterase family protein [Candidatus Omnitrophota bacterium]